MEDQLATLKAERLQEMTPETLNRLNRFAQRRLLSYYLPLLFVEDLPQDSIQDVIAGEDRHPTAENLANAAAFENYLRGIINSKVWGMSRRIRFEAMEPLPEHGPAAKIVAPTPAQAAHQSDLKETLFKLLKKQASPRDLPTVEEWHETFDHTDRIPVVNGNRKATWRVRKIARKVATKLALIS